MKTTKEIKELFIKYFTERGHKLIASSSLLPKNDSTLLFTNAGMNQFKGVFLGQESCTYKRAVTVQRCVRAGGKHNDLENVGYTKRHHTYFEMLGNFSFGDYFKREAIQYAWEFLTGKNWLNLPSEKLWITVHHDDEEAAKIWLDEIKINRNYLSRCGDDDNFWAMGETGPCGYCSEIYYDYGADIPGNLPGGKDSGERYVEIWNLVFMQFDRNLSGTLTALPNPSIDTGMGLERIAAVMQTSDFKEIERRGDNYHTDVFEKFTVILKKSLSNSSSSNKEFYTATRVVADHLRAAVALIADGVIPSNERAGYVLRKIIRRAIYHLWKLDVYQSNGGRLVFCEWIASNPFIDTMKNSFPELESSWNFKLKMIKEIVKTEEYQFLDTLDRGLKVLKKEISQLTGKTLGGDLVFYLKDTLGFPEDLTREIAKEDDITIDQKEFDIAKERQRQTSKGASKFKSTTAIKIAPDINTKFVGYEFLRAESQIIAIYNINGEQVNVLNNGEEGVVILEHTPFYAESGGQTGDTGTIEFANEHEIAVFDVTDTKKQGFAHLHIGNVRHGSFLNKQNVISEVNGDRRRSIKANHSAAHLLHKVLRDFLGSHIEQRGSSVTEHSLRFDFSHFSGLTHEELATIELEVNRKIWANLPVNIKIMNLDEAKHIGAIALFNEKYAEKVRVVSMGDFSLELCGGTHVNSTGEIGGFKILSEAAIAAGIRRIEACTAEQAFIYNQNLDKKLRTIATLFKTGINEIIPIIQQVLDLNKAQEKELLQLKNKMAINDCERLLTHVVNVGETKLLVAKLENIDAKILRTMLDQLLHRLDSALILLAATLNAKIQLVVGVSKDRLAYFSARDLAQYVATQLGGSAGGKNDIAQGGGTEIAKLDAALKSVLDWIKQKPTTRQ